MNLSYKNLVLFTIGLLLLACTDFVSFQYFLFLKIWVSAFSIYTCFYAKIDTSLILFVYFIIAIVFNPFYPIEFEREIWNGIDILSALVYVRVFYILKTNPDHTKEIETELNSNSKTLFELVRFFSVYIIIFLLLGKFYMALFEDVPFLGNALFASLLIFYLSGELGNRLNAYIEENENKEEGY